jgi:hypothetical protein
MISAVPEHQLKLGLKAHSFIPLGVGMLELTVIMSKVEDRKLSRFECDLKIQIFLTEKMK